MRKLCAPILALALLLTGCGLQKPAPTPAPTVDPYAGMVQVASGFGTKMWVKEYEELDVNPYLGRTDLDETGVSVGVDVSEHQGAIDWAALLRENEELDFAIIRAGYRGYGQSGKLCRDAFFEQNVGGAAEQGLQLGVYFFSQATTLAEAEEEADFLLDMLSLYVPETFTLPVFFDWERIEFDDARTDDVPGRSVTDFAIAFCDRIQEAGYTPGIYTYRYQGYFDYDLPRLTAYPWWVGALGDAPDFYYAHDFWQCDVVTDVAGIEGEVDVNIWFTPKPKAASPAAPATQDEPDADADAKTMTLIITETDEA